MNTKLSLSSDLPGTVWYYIRANQINNENTVCRRRHHLPPIVWRNAQEAGYAVTAVENGQEAWEAWQQDEYSLLISDWMMPDIDGLKLCRMIRAEPTLQHTYVILLTALGSKGDYLEVLKESSAPVRESNPMVCKMLMRGLDFEYPLASAVNFSNINMGSPQSCLLLAAPLSVTPCEMLFKNKYTRSIDWVLGLGASHYELGSHA